MRAFASGIGDLLALAQFQMTPYYRALGAEPRELMRVADRVLFNLREKLGKVPGSDEYYFHADDPSAPEYADRLDFFLPGGESVVQPWSRRVRWAIDAFGRTLPA